MTKSKPFEKQAFEQAGEEFGNAALSSWAKCCLTAQSITGGKKTKTDRYTSEAVRTIDTRTGGNRA